LIVTCASLSAWAAEASIIAAKRRSRFMPERCR
jgi:hypothetical protein